MNDTEQFNQKRDADHDYSSPGTYHLLFELGEHSSTFGSTSGGVMRLNAYGEIFLGVLGLALQIFSCLRLDAMDVRPRCVELVVTILNWRKPFFSRFTSDYERWHYRRTMTISAFAGYLKMNSGRGINKKRKRGGTHFWALGFKDRVLGDKKEIASVCSALHAGFSNTRCSTVLKADSKRASSLGSALATALGTATEAAFGALFSDAAGIGSAVESPLQPFDTMLLGRALFLNSSLLRPLPENNASEFGEGSDWKGALGGRTPESLIVAVGPGRIFLAVPSES